MLDFAGVLVLLSRVVLPEEIPSWDSISTMSLACGLGGAAGLVFLAVTARWCLGGEGPKAPSNPG